MNNYTVTFSIRARDEASLYEKIRALVAHYDTNWFCIEEGDRNEPNTSGEEN